MRDRIHGLIDKGLNLEGANCATARILIGIDIFPVSGVRKPACKLNKSGIFLSSMGSVLTCSSLKALPIEASVVLMTAVVRKKSVSHEKVQLSQTTLM